MSSKVMELLLEQKARLGSIQAVANVLGVSRTQVSLYLSGTYANRGGRADKLEAKVLEVFGSLKLCPHQQTEITPQSCQEARTAPMPTSDPAKLKLWIACKACPLNPKQQESKAC
ncbi:MAG: MarR family transcriptional regulator [Cohaesibacter sp.]|jgi:transcriptional regulator with XRE-family HTH domain|nr:MarR family transcriptional regulator [Cohaesibacter sp.]